MKQHVRRGKSATIGQNNEVHIQQVETHHYEGSLPHPAILREFNEIVVGSAEQLFKSVDVQSQHRREMQLKTIDANIYAQQQELQLKFEQNKAAFRSDLVGQTYGLFICALCIGGAIYVGMAGHTELAIALTVMPTATLIKEFFVKKAQ